MTPVTATERRSEQTTDMTAIRPFRVDVPESDDILDNITITWLTNTALSGARLYWENKGASFFAVKGVSVAIPVAVSVFPDELYPAREVGRNGRIPSSSTTTSTTKAGTSRPGNSHNSCQRTCERASDHCARSREALRDGHRR